MSLTRREWELMWTSIKAIEVNANKLKSPPTRQKILWEVKFIKSMIEQVIGQME